MTVNRINYDECTDCQICYEICPMDVYRLDGDKVVIAYQQDCMCCYLCEIDCANGAIEIDAKRGHKIPFPF